MPEDQAEYHQPDPLLGDPLLSPITIVTDRFKGRDTAWIIPSLERILPSSSRYECSPVLLNMLPDLTR